MACEALGAASPLANVTESNSFIFAIDTPHPHNIMRTILVCISEIIMQPSAPPPSEKAANASTPRISSQSLFKGQSMVEIEHAGQCYQLRITRENKLLLTK